MREFSDIELNFISKLLNRVKYHDLDKLELNQFSNSPIGNSILDKIQTKFEPYVSEVIKRNKKLGIKEFCFEMDNYVGEAIKSRLKHMDVTSFIAINKMDFSEVEKFAKDILGPIKYNQEELNKLSTFLIELAKEKNDINTK